MSHRYPSLKSHRRPPAKKGDCSWRSTEDMEFRNGSCSTVYWKFVDMILVISDYFQRSSLSFIVSHSTIKKSSNLLFVDFIYLLFNLNKCIIVIWLLLFFSDFFRKSFQINSLTVPGTTIMNFSTPGLFLLSWLASQNWNKLFSVTHCLSQSK